MNNAVRPDDPVPAAKGSTHTVRQVIGPVADDRIAVCVDSKQADCARVAVVIGGARIIRSDRAELLDSQNTESGRLGLLHEGRNCT